MSCTWKLSKARKRHKCLICGRFIQKQEEYYRITMIEDQQFSQWGSCHEKCFDGLMGSLKRKHGKMVRPEQWTPAEIRNYRLCAIGGKHEKHRNDGDEGENHP